MSSPKPRVTVHPYADHYAPAGERIIEYSFPDGKGGLISFRMCEGVPTVDLYCKAPAIRVLVP